MTTKDIILEIIVGAFKRSLIVSEMVEMNKIAIGIDMVTKAHYFEFMKWFIKDEVFYGDRSGKYITGEMGVAFDTLEDLYQHWIKITNNKV